MQDTSLGGERDLAQGTDRLPQRCPAGAHQAMRYRRAWQDGDRAESGRGRELPDAARGVPGFVGEIPIPDMAAERTYRIRHPGDENAARDQRIRNVVKGLEHLLFRQMFQHVGSRYGGEAADPFLENVPVVAFAHLVQPGRAGECHLLGTDIDTLDVIAVGAQQTHQFALPAADVYDQSGTRRRQQRADVTAVDQSSSLTAAAAGVLRCVRLIQPVPH